MHYWRAVSAYVRPPESRLGARPAFKLSRTMHCHVSPPLFSTPLLQHGPLLRLHVANHLPAVLQLPLAHLLQPYVPRQAREPERLPASSLAHRALGISLAGLHYIVMSAVKHSTPALHPTHSHNQLPPLPPLQAGAPLCVTPAPSWPTIRMPAQARQTAGLCPAVRAPTASPTTSAA